MSRRGLVRTVTAVSAVLLLGACTGGEATGTTGTGVPAAAAAAQVPGEEVTVPAQGITVTGEGRVTGKPDVLRVTVGASVTAEETQEALETANTKASAIIETLKEQGVDEDDIQTQEFSIHPQYGDPRGDGEPAITGYTVTNLVEAKIRELDRAGDIMDAAVAAGGQGTRVHGVQFSLEDNEALLADARQAAFANAREKAQQYAELAEVGLGEVVSISEIQSNRPVPMPFAEDAAEAAGARASVPIETGQQEVSVMVTTVWSLGG